MVIANPDVLDAMTTPGRAARSTSASTRRLTGPFSGAFSCTTSASPTAPARLSWKASRSGLAPSRSPIRSSSGQFDDTMRSRSPRASGDGSYTSTSKPVRR